MRASTTLVFLIPVLLSATLPARAGGAQARAWLVSQGYAPPQSGQIVVCHGYGCSRRAVLATEPWLARAAAILQGNDASPAAERQALGEVVRLYTATIRATLGGRPDVPGSPPSLSGTYGQMDCLDVTANTIGLLLVLEEHRLLRHHEVDPPQSRGLFFDGRYPHFTAVVEQHGGTRWAVDPWRKALGQRPDVLPLSSWQRASG